MKQYRVYYHFVLVFALAGCQSDFLDVKPDKSWVVPTELADLQALLDAHIELNIAPSLPLPAADNFLVPDPYVQYLTVVQRNSYTWQPDIYEGGIGQDWNILYKIIFYANVVIDGAEKALEKQEDLSSWRSLKAAALFYRSMAFYHLVELFCVPYARQTASESPGIPLRFSPNVDELEARHNLQACYDQIISDLKQALIHLPESVVFTTRPSKPACWALLARVYLSMHDYQQAEEAASACLVFKPGLLDFNTLDVNSPRPLPLIVSRQNPEILYEQILSSSAFASIAGVDTLLFELYEENDLRKPCFFHTTSITDRVFKGSYTGSNQLFGGLSTNEVYLIRAESYARNSKPELAIEDLNRLLKARWKEGSFEPLQPALAELLPLILTERRKELVARGMRWFDLRRLNSQTELSARLTRSIGSEYYELLPGDKRYVFPIPDNEIEFSGIAQNPR